MLKELTDSSQWDRCISTSRWGVFTKKIEPNEEWVKGEVKDDRVDHALKTHGWYQEKNTKLVQGNIQAVMYRLFAHTFTSWEMFATTRYDGKSKKLPAEEFLSLEFVHNNIHVSFPLKAKPMVFCVIT